MLHQNKIMFHQADGCLRNL